MRKHPSMPMALMVIVLLILTHSLERWGRFGWLGVTALWVVMLLALWSAADYFLKFSRVVLVNDPGLTSR